MDTYKNKAFSKSNYLNREDFIPYYYDTVGQREVRGLGLNMSKSSQWAAHKVKESDNLDYLALKYYNNPTLWWVIAYFNNINDAFEKLYGKYDILRIPNITSITFKESR